MLVSSLDVGAVLGHVRREVADLFAVPGGAVTLLLRRGEAYAPLEPGPAAPASSGEAAAVDLDEAPPPRRRRAHPGAVRRGPWRCAIRRPLRVG